MPGGTPGGASRMAAHGRPSAAAGIGIQRRTTPAEIKELIWMESSRHWQILGEAPYGLFNDAGNCPGYKNLQNPISFV